EVLREHEHPPALDGAMAGDHAVAVGAGLHHVEVRVAVLHEDVQLDERTRGEQLAALAVPLDRAWRAGVQRLAAQLLERLQPFLGGVLRHQAESLPERYQPAAPARTPRRGREPGTPISRW